MSGITDDAATLARDIDIDQARARFDIAMADETLAGYTMPKVAEKIGVAYSTLHAWAKGKYAGNTGEIARKVNAWLATREAVARTQSDQRRGPTFMRTKTAERIIALLEYAQATPDMIVITGDPGVGKTLTCQNYQATHSNVFLVTAEPAMNTVNALLDTLSDTLGTGEQYRGIQMSRRIRRRLEGTAGLLIVDEAQHLQLKQRDQLRAMAFDGAQIGVALVGNDELAVQFSRERATGRNAQLSSRVGQKLSLRRPFKSDVETLLDGWGVTNADARALALGVAMQPGALRLMGRVLRNSFSLCGLREEPEPTVKDVRDACLALGVNL